MPNLYRRKGIWHYSFTIGGRRIRKSSEQTDEDLAFVVAEKHEARERRASVLGAQAELTFFEAVDMYLDHKPDARFLAPLVRHFGKMKVAEINQPSIRRAARALYPDAGPATWNRQVITPVRAVVNFAAEEGLCQHLRMKRFPEGERKRRPAGTKAWLKAFQGQARAQGLPHLAAMARFMFETGARIGQACALKWDDVDLSAGSVKLRTRKTGANGPETRERTAWLTAAMIADIANMGDRHPRLVFRYASRSSAQKGWCSVIDKAKLPKLTPHEAGRHGFATEMIVRGKVDVATAADRGGWQSKRLMLEVYVHGQEGRGVIDDVFGERPARRGRKT